MKVFVAGEGSDEIGDFVHDPTYRRPECEGGILEALLRRSRAVGWVIADGCPWRRVRKFAFGRDLHGREFRNVLGIVDQAAEAGCDIVAFVRDRDGEIDRQAAIEIAIAEVARLGLNVAVIGGVAVETVDAWILACLGEVSSEDVRDPKSVLQTRFGLSKGAEKVEVIANANLGAVPTDARSLNIWRERAKTVLERDEPRENSS
jgi:hypothetical protein